MAPKKRNTATIIPPLTEPFNCDACSLENTRSAFEGVMREYVLVPNYGTITVDDIINQCFPAMTTILEHSMNAKVNVKAWCTIQVLFHKVNFADGTVEVEDRD